MLPIFEVCRISHEDPVRALPSNRQRSDSRANTQHRERVFPSTNPQTVFRELAIKNQVVSFSPAMPTTDFFLSQNVLYPKRLFRDKRLRTAFFSAKVQTERRPGPQSQGTTFPNMNSDYSCLLSRRLPDNQSTEWVETAQREYVLSSVFTVSVCNIFEMASCVNLNVRC